MSLDVVADLIERYLNDPAFQAAFAQDPDEAVAAAGFKLDECERAALHSSISARDDQALHPRVPKYSFGS